jgi:hypothetical protein
MKDFKDIKEGLLAGQEETMKVGDATAKEMAEAKEILKMMPAIETINDRLMHNYPGRGTDANGVWVRKGDLIGYTNGNSLCDDGLRYGIVVDLQPSVAGYTVLVGGAESEYDETLELYPGAAAYFVDAHNCIVLASKKDAPAMLKLLLKIH